MMVETKQLTAGEVLWINRVKRNQLSFFGTNIYKHYNHTSYTSKVYTASSTFLSLLDRKVLVKRNGFIEVAEDY
jgi:hypothetical protein